MSKSRLLLPVVTFLLMAVTTETSPQQPPISYNHKIELNGKEIDVPQVEIEKWRKKISKPMKSANEQVSPKGVTKAVIAKLAQEFGLLEKPKINPDLVFTNNDISYWSGQPLDAPELELQFAARRLVLDAADKQQRTIADKKILAEAAQKLIPFLKEEKQLECPASIICEGNTSRILTQQAWEGLQNGGFEKTLACTCNTIRRWSRQADEQQTKAVNKDCGNTPSPSELESYFSSNWALSDVATSYFIRGELFYKQGRWAEAKEAYKIVIDKYKCAFTWDTNGWFWRTADGAQEKYDEIRLK
jgi:tetratricopeptide (TPR) repeat protein